MLSRKFWGVFWSFFLILLISGIELDAQQITDLIEPVNLISGRTDSILISDMFYSNNYSSLVLKNNSSVSVKFNHDKSKLIFTPNPDAEGLFLINFSFKNNSYAIPVRVIEEQTVTFTFHPSREYNKVFLFGSFNSWNRSDLKMNEDNGIYNITIPLEPGRYQYKFFADGAELIDSLNPEKIPNGMGDYNSVVTVEPKHKTESFLFTNGDNLSPKGSEFSYIYRNKETNSLLEVQDLAVLLDNKIVPSKYIKIKGDTIDISFPGSELHGKKTLRTAVSKDGQSTNIQNVIMFDGIPAGKDNKHFTWHDAIIYSALIDRFYDGDKSLDKPVQHDSLFQKANYMGGDFQGLIDKFNEGYFDSLGITTLWISPVYQNTKHAFRESPKPHRWFSGYHGYWPVEARGVEDEFGTMGKLKELINTAHKHNIKVLLDIVAHHVHQEHPYFKEHRDWFGQLKLPDGRLNIRLWDEERLTTWFDPYLPTFDFIHSVAAVNAVTNDAIWWLETTGADGYRQDAVKHIPNNFWRVLNKKVRQEVEIPNHKTVFQMGETFGGYELVKSYVNNGQLPAQFNFNLYDVAIPSFLSKDGSFENLNKEIKKGLYIFGEDNLMGNIMGSQDKDRYMAYADGDLQINDGNSIEIGWNDPPKVDSASSYSKERLYLSYLLTIPGIPTVYYGDEIGMTGAADPDNRRIMRFGNQLTSLEKDNLVNVRKIIHLRDSHPALRYGDYYCLQADEKIFAYVRSDMNERILTVLNKNADKQSLSLNFPETYSAHKLVDLFTGETVAVINNTAQINIDGISSRFFSIVKN
jgi:cyclomaltodextrinase / maltogenic alpha-amylase / neopullulanase